METGLHNGLLDFLTALNRSESIDCAWQSTTAFMSDLGASHTGVNIDPDGSDPMGLWTTPEWVQDMYLSEVYPCHDPKREHCRRNVTPYFYGKEFWHLEANLPTPRRKLDEEIADIGMRSAIVIPIHRNSGREWGFFGMTCDMDAGEFEHLFSERGMAIHLAGLAVSNCIRALAKADEGVAIGLSHRERECLLWLGRGFRNDQIADCLGLRPVTVEYHLANARRKLNARTREQALVNAIRLEIIDP